MQDEFSPRQTVSQRHRTWRILRRHFEELVAQHPMKQIFSKLSTSKREGTQGKGSNQDAKQPPDYNQLVEESEQSTVANQLSVFHEDHSITIKSGSEEIDEQHKALMSTEDGCQKSFRCHQPVSSREILSNNSFYICHLGQLYVRIITGGDVWIYGDAQVHPDVTGREVHIYDDARVTSRILARRNLQICGNSRASGDVRSKGDVTVSMNCRVSGNVFVEGTLTVSGNSLVSGDIIARKDAWIRDNARVTGRLIVRGKIHLEGDAYICDYNLEKKK